MEYLKSKWVAVYGTPLPKSIYKTSNNKTGDEIAFDVIKGAGLSVRG